MGCYASRLYAEEQQYRVAERARKIKEAKREAKRAMVIESRKAGNDQEGPRRTRRKRKQPQLEPKRSKDRSKMRASVGTVKPLHEKEPHDTLNAENNQTSDVQMDSSEIEVWDTTILESLDMPETPAESDPVNNSDDTTAVEASDGVNGRNQDDEGEDQIVDDRNAEIQLDRADSTFSSVRTPPTEPYHEVQFHDTWPKSSLTSPDFVPSSLIIQDGVEDPKFKSFLPCNREHVENLTAFSFGIMKTEWGRIPSAARLQSLLESFREQGYFREMQLTDSSDPSNSSDCQFWIFFSKTFWVLGAMRIVDDQSLNAFYRGGKTTGAWAVWTDQETWILKAPRLSNQALQRLENRQQSSRSA